MTKKAGEVVCTYLDLEQDEFMYFRENGDITIIEHLDPIQMLMPVPLTSKVIKDLEKDKAIVILNEVLNAAVNVVKENKALLKIKRE